MVNKTIQKLIESTNNGYQEKHWEAYKALVESGEIVYHNLPSLETTRNKPSLVVCTAYSGSGKTTLGDEFAKRYDWMTVDSDRVREEMFGGLQPPENEARLTKALTELRDHFLRYGYNTILTTCSVNNRYRELYLSTNISVAHKILLHLMTSRGTIGQRRKKGTLEFMDSLWEEPDSTASFMKGVKYIKINSNSLEDIDRNINRVLKEL